MDRFARIIALHQILAGRRRPVSLDVLARELECSASTVKRAVRELRDTLGAPLVAEPDGTGYRYDRQTETRWELPGLWFSADQLLALATMDWLLESLAPSLLGPLLEPVRTRVGELLGAQGQERGELARRIRLLPLASRPIANTTFLPVAGALIKRRRLAFCYRTVPRTVSPQRLAHYRDNWYLDAWCHNRNDLRTFALSRIAEPQELHQTADDIPDDQLDAHFAGAYGIFAGRPDKEAVLRFHGEITERIAEETWHPHQRTRWLPDGRYELIVPYYDPRELIRDVLRHGSDVVVVSPLDLREEVSSRHKAAAALYE